MTLRNQFFPDYEARAELSPCAVFERASGPCILLGCGLMISGGFLAFGAGATMTGLGLSLIAVAGAGMVGYGIYLGMQALKTHAELEFTIDIQPLGKPIESCWERFWRLVS